MTLLMNPFFLHSKGVETNQEIINEIYSGEITSFDGNNTDNITDTGEADVLDQDLASPKDMVTTLVLQKEIILRPLTNDEITTIMELCDINLKTILIIH